MIKKVTIITVIFAAAVLFWIAAEPWINSATKFRDVSQWVLPLVALIVLSAFVCVSLMVFKDRWVKNSIFAIVMFPAFLVFGLNQYLVAALAINFLFYRIAMNRIDSEKTARLKISAYNMARKGMLMVIMPILITVSFAYYLSPLVQESVGKEELPPSVSSFIDRTVTGVLDSDRLTPGMSQSQENAIKNTFMDEFNEMLKSFFGDYYKFLPPILAFGLFLILQGLSYVFIWPAIWLCVTAFGILKRTGMVKIEKTQVEIEKIVY